MVMTAQEIFDKVCNHLANQKVKCVDEAGSCLYRDSINRRMCAAGCLIPDDEYSQEMEGESFRAVLALYPALQETFLEHELLISKLQQAHDGFMPNHVGEDYSWFVESLNDIAMRFNLKLPESIHSLGVK